MNTPFSSSAFTSPIHNNSLAMQQSIPAYPGTSYDSQHHASSSHHRQSQNAVAKGSVQEHQAQGETQHDSSVGSKSRSTPSPGPVFSSVASVTPPLVSQVLLKIYSFNLFVVKLCYEWLSANLSASSFLKCILLVLKGNLRIKTQINLAT